MDRIRSTTHGLIRLAMFLVCLASVAHGAAPFPPEILIHEIDPIHGGDGSIGVLLNGFSADDDEKGDAVGGAGDIDGDGLADMLIGGPGDGSGCDRCAAYVAFGGYDLPPSIDLLEVPYDSNGADAFIVLSREANDRGGLYVSGIGDLNADGLDDFAVGAPWASPGGIGLAGEVYVVFGRTSGYPPAFDAASLLPPDGDGSAGFIVNGAEDYEEVGQTLGGPCDFNADGIDDLLIGVNGAGVAVGSVYVVFGRTSGYPAEFDLARLLPANGGDGSEGAVIDALDPDHWAGTVACAGDMNGDGIDDVLMGALRASPRDLFFAGEAYVVYGRSHGFPPVFSVSSLFVANGGDGSQGFVLFGIEPYDETGGYVGDAGDLNADGHADIAIGTIDADSRVFVVFGRGGSFPPEFELARLLRANGGDGTEGVVFNSDDAAQQAKSAGDVNADGVSDLIIGAPILVGPFGGQGGAYVVFGQAGGFPAEFELSNLREANGGDGTRGVVLVGGDNPNGWTDTAGTSVDGAGDVNGDGADDVLVGSSGSRGLSGTAYLVFGHPNDTDGDGVADARDNCSALANADQRDTNGDGFGNACDADLDDDCTVNFVDLGLMKSVFYTSDPDADLDGSGTVNFADLAIMKAGFFLPPGPSGLSNACSR